MEPHGALDPPRDLIGAGIWLQTAFQRIVYKDDLSKPTHLSVEELRSVLSIADAASRKEPRNAFWQQSRCVFLGMLGLRTEAQKAWVSGARCDYWKDYQTERLFSSQVVIARILGSSQAWQYALAYAMRSDSAAVAIERTARSMIASSGYVVRRDLEIRYATLRNGELMRNGGRAIKISSPGANVVELAAFPKDLAGSMSPKRLWIGQNDFLTGLARAGRSIEYEHAHDVFQSNDGWRALALNADYDLDARNLTLAAIVTSAGPSALLVASAAGGALWLLGLALKRTGELKTYTWPPVAFAAAALGFFAFKLTSTPLAGLAVALCIAFALVSPPKSRNVQPEDLGPLFTFTAFTLSTCATAALSAFAIGRSTAAAVLFPRLGVPSEYYERPTLAGLALVIVSLVILVAPLWALVHKLGTPHVVAVAVSRLGAMMCVGSLLLAVVAGPVAVFADKRLLGTFFQLLGNEPVYYLVQ